MAPQWYDETFRANPKNMFCRSIAAVLAALTGAMAVADILVVDMTGQPVPSAIVLLADGDRYAAPKDIIVDQIDKHFEPFVSITAPGSRVRFPNSDDIRHHVYSFSDAKTFELKLYHANDAEPVEFKRAGLVTLGCNVHDTMKTYGLVTPNPGAVSDETHQEMAIGEVHFNAIVEDLIKAMDDENIPTRAQNQLLQRLAALHGEITGR